MRHTSKLSRRSFLGMGLGALVSNGRLLERSRRPDASRGDHADARPGHADARLTARPGTPTVSATTGSTTLDLAGRSTAILRVPPDHNHDRPAPLLVALHGGGGRATRWTELYDDCDRRGIVLLAPESLGRSWDRVGGRFGPDVALIDEALRQTFGQCAIDPMRLCLAGFSDGASYALSLGPPNGDLFTHLIAWSPGFSDPQDPIVGSPRVFVSHGSADRVLPVGGTRHALVPMFEMDGYRTEYVEFEGGHEMPQEIIDHALDWFLG